LAASPPAGINNAKGASFGPKQAAQLLGFQRSEAERAGSVMENSLRNKTFANEFNTITGDPTQPNAALEGKREPAAKS